MSAVRAAKFKHYQPKRWHPEFDLIVMGSISGASNDELARKFGYTKQHISNILSSPQAEEVKNRIRTSINNQFQGTIQDRLARVGEKVVQRVENFVNDDNLAEKSPFNFIEKVTSIARTFGGSTGITPSGSSTAGVNINNGVVNHNTLVISNDKADLLRQALNESKALEAVIK